MSNLYFCYNILHSSLQGYMVCQTTAVRIFSSDGGWLIQFLWWCRFISWLYAQTIYYLSFCRGRPLFNQRMLVTMTNLKQHLWKQPFLVCFGRLNHDDGWWFARGGFQYQFAAAMQTVIREHPLKIHFPTKKLIKQF